MCMRKRVPITPSNVLHFRGQTRQDMAMMQPGLNDKTWMMIIKVYQVNVSLPLASKTHPFIENPHIHLNKYLGFVCYLMLY